MYLENNDPTYDDLLNACREAYADQNELTPVAGVCWEYNLPENMFDKLLADF